jgi:hypothetical protein
MTYQKNQRNRRPAYSRQPAHMASAQATSQPAIPDVPVTYAWAQEYWQRRTGNGNGLIVEAKTQVAVIPERAIKGRTSATLVQLLISMQDDHARVTITKFDEPYALNGHTVQLRKEQSGDYTLTFTPTKNAAPINSE